MKVDLEQTKGLGQVLEDLSTQYHAVGSKFHQLRSVKEGHYNVDIEPVRYQYQDETGFSVRLTPEELASAPKSIQMVMYDLGLSEERNPLSLPLEPDITLEVVLKGIDLPLDRAYGFSWTLMPNEITADRVGLTLSERGVEVHGPRERVFDGVHQYVHALYGRGEAVYNIYSRQLSSSSYDSRHPFMVQILTDAANWTVDIVNNRKKDSTAG